MEYTELLNRVKNRMNNNNHIETWKANHHGNIMNGYNDTLRTLNEIGLATRRQGGN